MKVLNISNDAKVADKDSQVAQRISEYGELVERYSVLVLAESDKFFQLNKSTDVFAIAESNAFLNALKLKKQAKKILRSDDYDVITVQDAYVIGSIAAKLAKKFKLGLEVQVHGFEKLTFFNKLLARRVFKKAGSIRVVSERLKKKLIEEFNVLFEKINVIPIFVETRFDPESRVPSPEYSGRYGTGPRTAMPAPSADEFVFLSVGRMVEVKNIELQIKALASIINDYPQARLWIVGDGPERNKLEARSKELEIQEKVKFFGWQVSQWQFYKQAHAFLLTSNSEGWGMAVVEAAQAGLPVIMTDVGLAGEVIKNNESGIVISVGDQRALEQAMIKLIDDSELRKKLGEKAFEAVQKLPSQEQTIKKMISSWEKATKKTEKKR
ncbi:MAG: glycosyltransferase family 4 protein [bacterium]|nr:glycosyltransferase family 4 protein [bacterium]